MAFRVIPFAKPLDPLINQSLHVIVPKVWPWARWLFSWRKLAEKNSVENCWLPILQQLGKWVLQSWIGNLSNTPQHPIHSIPCTSGTYFFNIISSPHLGRAPLVFLLVSFLWETYKISGRPVALPPVLSWSWSQGNDRYSLSPMPQLILDEHFQSSSSSGLGGLYDRWPLFYEATYEQNLCSMRFSYLWGIQAPDYHIFLRLWMLHLSICCRHWPE